MSYERRIRIGRKFLKTQIVSSFVQIHFLILIIVKKIICQPIIVLRFPPHPSAAWLGDIFRSYISTSHSHFGSLPCISRVLVMIFISNMASSLSNSTATPPESISSCLCCPHCLCGMIINAMIKMQLVSSGMPGIARKIQYFPRPCTYRPKGKALSLSIEVQISETQRAPVSKSAFCKDFLNFYQKSLYSPSTPQNPMSLVL